MTPTTTPLNRRDMLRFSLGGLAAASACGLREEEASASKRPNIVLIMADDMGFSDLSCYGSEIRTPHLDELAAKGLRFTQFYNAARCCPTRASLMTGLYPHQTGVGHMTSDYGRPGYRGDLNRECVTIAEVLKPAGYTTLMSGKWHVTPHDGPGHNWPRRRGFDRFYGTILGAGSFYDPVTLVRDDEPIEADSEDYYYTGAIADNAVRFIQDHKGQDNPFFLYTAFTAPHWPLHAPDPAIARYRDRYNIGWDQLRGERHRRMIDLGIVDERWPLTPRDEQVPPWSQVAHKEWHARRMEVYAAQVALMDKAVGRIVDALRETGFEDNTLILFLADNGGCAEELSGAVKGDFIPEKTRDGRPVQRGNDPSVMPGPETTYQSYGVPWANASNTPFRLYKHWVHEGGIATPLIAYWPSRIQQHGSLIHEPGHLIDIMATAVDLGEAEYPSEYEGHRIHAAEGTSLTPIFEGRSLERENPIFWEHEGNRAIRQGNWKLVSRWRGKSEDHWDLFDMEADRTEINDLASSDPERAAALLDSYQNWASRSNVLPWRSWEEQ